jgi:hypothetical protein
MQKIVRAGLATAAMLAIGAGIAHALPPDNTPKKPFCHYKTVCRRDCQVLQYNGHCSLWKTVCTQVRVCEDL